jgi:hypothetical protein
MTGPGRQHGAKVAQLRDYSPHCRAGSQDGEAVPGLRCRRSIWDRSAPNARTYATGGTSDHGGVMK